MSTAYFIVLDRDDPGFDSFVDGKMLTKQLGAVNKIANELGLKKFEDYAFQDLSEVGGPELEPEWFGATEGIKWASLILQQLRDNPGAVKDIDAVIEDLENYIRVFKEAEKRTLKWHLELDF